MRHGVLSHVETALLAALLVVPCTDLLAPEGAPGAEASKPARMAQAVRRVQVHRVWCEPRKGADDEPGILVYAHAESLGIRWESLVVECRLRTLDGKPVRVAAKAPEGYADEKGRFLISSRVPILDDKFEWPELRAPLPYRKVLALPPGQPQRLVLVFRASAGGLSSMAEAEVTFPDAGEPRVSRSVGLLAIDVFPNRAAPQTADSSAKTAKEGDRIRHAATGRGLTVWGYAGAVGLAKRKMVGRLSLWDEERAPLLSTDRKTGAKKPFESKAEVDVFPHQAQALQHFVPYRAIGLKPGNHRLLLRYTAACEGLTAVMEEEHVIRVAADNRDAALRAEGDGASGPDVRGGSRARE